MIVRHLQAERERKELKLLAARKARYLPLVNLNCQQLVCHS